MSVNGFSTKFRRQKFTYSPVPFITLYAHELSRSRVIGLSVILSVRLPREALDTRLRRRTGYVLHKALLVFFSP